MQRLNRTYYESAYGKSRELDYPERVLQFGEGNFLRGFVDWMIHSMNKKDLFKGRAVIVQPIKKGLVDVVNEQDGFYTLLLRGIENGEVVEKEEIITSVKRGINPYRDYKDYLQCAKNPDLRFIISNTTEAGIAYKEEDMNPTSCPESFPAKVAVFLYERYKAFEGASDKGMILVPCELIDRNGDKLKEYVLKHAKNWELGDKFKDWLLNSNYFLNTLVDRIVTGYPKDEADAICERVGYKDCLIDTGEIFHLWVIEGDKELAKELPLKEAGLNVVWTDNLKFYRDRKVRILNGAHTMTVPAAYLYGLRTVREATEDKVFSKYIKKGLLEEIVPVLELPDDEKIAFANAVSERFSNPFIHHKLISISLNSISKWKVRVLPSLLDYVEEMNKLPQILTFSLAALIVFYRVRGIKEGMAYGLTDSNEYTISDNDDIIFFFKKIWDEYSQDANLRLLINCVLSNEKLWDRDLTKIEGFSTEVEGYVNGILENGINEVVTSIVD